MGQRIVNTLNQISTFLDNNKTSIVLGDMFVFIGLFMSGDFLDIAFLSFKTIFLAVLGGLFGIVGKYLGEVIVKKLKK